MTDCTTGTVLRSIVRDGIEHTKDINECEITLVHAKRVGTSEVVNPGGVTFKQTQLHLSSHKNLFTLISCQKHNLDEKVLAEFFRKAWDNEARNRHKNMREYLKEVKKAFTPKK